MGIESGNLSFEARRQRSCTNQVYFNRNVILLVTRRFLASLHPLANGGHRTIGVGHVSIYHSNPLLGEEDRGHLGSRLATSYQ